RELVRCLGDQVGVEGVAGIVREIRGLGRARLDERQQAAVDDLRIDGLDPRRQVVADRREQALADAGPAKQAAAVGREVRNRGGELLPGTHPAQRSPGWNVSSVNPSRLSAPKGTASRSSTMTRRTKTKRRIGASIGLTPGWYEESRAGPVS